VEVLIEHNADALAPSTSFQDKCTIPPSIRKLVTTTTQPTPPFHHLKRKMKSENKITTVD